MFKRAVCLAAGIALAGPPAFAGPITGFASFTPLPASVPAGSLPEAAPFLLSSPNFSQKTVSANGAVGSPSATATTGT